MFQRQQSVNSYDQRSPFLDLPQNEALPCQVVERSGFLTNVSLIRRQLSRPFLLRFVSFHSGPCMSSHITLCHQVHSCTQEGHIQLSAAGQDTQAWDQLPPLKSAGCGRIKGTAFPTVGISRSTPFSPSSIIGSYASYGLKALFLKESSYFY